LPAKAPSKLVDFLSAKEADAALKKKAPIDPLHGVPVTTKLNVDVKGEATTNGVAANRNLIAPEDSAEAFPWDEAPHYLIRDRDRIYGSVVTRRLRTTGIRDKPTAPGSPWQNGFAERLIGSIRRECVDHILGEMHLRRVLKSYDDYYNSVRTHRSLNKGCAGHSPNSANRKHQITRHPWRTSPPLRPSLSFRYTRGEPLSKGTARFPSSSN
jgi:hypothetical protein